MADYSQYFPAAGEKATDYSQYFPPEAKAAAMPQPASAPEMTAGERAGRVAGLGGRALATGVLGLPVMLGEAANQAYNLGARSLGAPQRSSVMEGFNTFLTNAGLPEPATPVERFSTAVTGGMVGTGGQMGMARAAQELPATAGQLVRQTMLQQPARQVVAGGTSGAAAQSAAEAGLGPAGQTIAGVAGGMAPFAGQMISGMPTPEQMRTREVAASARNAGLRLPPSQAGGGLVNSTLEGWVAGKAPTDRTLSVKNAPEVNRIVKQDLPGFQQDKPLTFANLEDYRRVQAEPYRELARQGLGNELEQLKTARFNASENFKFWRRSGDPEVLNKARAFDAEVQRLEGIFDAKAKQLSRPELVDDLNKSRTNIAKSYTVEKALDDVTGNIDARILASELDKGAPLTGGMRTIGKAAGAYPMALRTPEQVGAPAGRDVLGTSLALGGFGGAAATGNPVFLGLSALPFARPAVRSLITSRLYQGAMVNPQLDPLSRGGAASLGILSGGQGQTENRNLIDDILRRGY